ncbi:MAG: protein-glutamate O-methyltransferase CheR [SAR324 cluster bacterium]|nr:protein-glutamate O-methyltransferase CheR [SAR324 cluster bacterium]
MVPQLTNQELEQFAEIAYKELGIIISNQKHALLQNRLGRRLRELGLRSFREYYQYLLAHKAETQEFIEAVTTNETYFFRCPKHFHMLGQQIFPNIKSELINIWSAACSNGSEPYSLAIVAHERLPDFEKRSVNVWASDIDLKILKKADEGVYDTHLLRLAREDVLHKYFIQIKPQLYQVIPALREMLLLGQHNLQHRFNKAKMDVIFCRNVLIYFDNQSKQTVFQNLIEALKPGGYLFLGESEIIPDLPGMHRIDASVAVKK